MGYDISSFNADGTERLIEVKTTALGKNSPFLMTMNELEFAEANPHRLSVYRVFNFPVAPRVYVLAAPLAAACRVVTAVYRVYPGASPDADQ